MKLTDLKCRTAKTPKRVTRLADGNGLSLVLHPNGGKYWQGRYRVMGKEQTHSIGPYPEVSLAEARQAWTEARASIRTHGYIRVDERPKTLRDIYKQWTDDMLPERGRKRAIYSMDTLILPYLGGKPLTDIEPSDIVAVIRKLNAIPDKTSAHFGFSYIKRVMSYAVMMGYIKMNPAAELAPLVKHYKPTSHRHLPHDELKEFLALLNTVVDNTGKLDYKAVYHKLMMMVFVRSVELCTARWEDIDLDAGVWVVPAERMKKRRPHVVPLSTQAVALLRAHKAEAPSNEWVISYNGLTHVSYHTVRGFLSDIQPSHTTHGTRALAATILQDAYNYPYDVIKTQLSHVRGDATQQAYDRAEFMTKRRELMQTWSDHLDKQLEAVEVPFKGMGFYRARS